MDTPEQHSVISIESERKQNILLLHFQYQTSLTSNYNCVAYRIALPFKVQMAKTDRREGAELHL